MTTHSHNHRGRRAFTLIELMISIALVLILMIGINQVFKVTGQAVGTTQAIAEGVRGARAVQSCFEDDLKSIVTREAPFMIIRSQRIAAFRNRADEAGDGDYVPAPTATPAQIDQAIRTVDLDGDGIESTVAGNPEFTPRTLLGRRNFRIDQLSFFRTGKLRRQTGNDGVYAANMTSNEAWVWYGHLKLPDPTQALNAHKEPGTGIPVAFGNPENAQTNPNNFYASQWILGRFAMLLREPDPSGQIYDDSNPPIVQEHIPRQTGDMLLEPLGQRSPSTGTGTAQFEVQWGRYDLAGTTMALFKPILTNIIATPPAGIPKWYEGTRGLSYRFQANPYPPTPLDSLEMARCAPLLLPHCSQFIVEFAGDFVQQSQGPPINPGTNAGELMDTDGDGTAIGQDGQIDFIVNPVTGVRSIRWYGFPRDVSSNTPGNEGRPDGSIPGPIPPGSTNNTMPDVVPVRDVIATSPLPADAGKSMAFERDIHAGASPSNKLPPKADYTGEATATFGVPLDAQYLCAWQPAGTYTDPIAGTPVGDPPYPQLIRITIMIDDPSGRIADGQTFEYVFRVGG